MNTTVDGRTRAAWQGWALGLATLWALSGCGGGGTTETNVDIIRPTPASQGDVTPAAQASALLFTRQDESDDQAARMVVMDQNSGQIVWTQPTDKLQDYALTYSRAFDAYGVPQQKLAARQLVYIYDHHIYGLTLTPQPTVQQYQISSTADACSIQRVIEADASGLSAWLVVITAGPDHECDSTDGVAQRDNKQMVVSTTWGVATAATDYPLDTNAPTLPVTDSQGVLTGILGYHAAARSLVMLGADGRTTGVTGGGLNFPSDLFIYGRTPGQTKQAYVRIGREIRIVDWSGSVPSVKPMVVTTLTSPARPALSDQQYLYIIDGGALMRLDGQGNVTTLVNQPGFLNTVWQTPDYIVIDQYPSEGGVAWYAIAKKTGQAQMIYKSSGYLDHVLVTTGNVVLKETRVNDTNLTNAITRYDLDKGTSELIDGEARNIFSLSVQPVALGLSTPISHLLLCHVDAATGACPASQAFIYDIQANTRRALASSTLALTEAPWRDFDIQLYALPGPRYLFSTSAELGNTATSKIWMFDVNAEGSLTPVH